MSETLAPIKKARKIPKSSALVDLLFPPAPSTPSVNLSSVPTPPEEDSLSDVSSDVEAQLIQASRKSPEVFIEYALGLKLCNMHREWLYIVQHNRSSCIFGPRSHGKSTLISVGYPIWRLGTNPNIRIKIAAQADGNAAKLVGEIAENIENNPRVHKVFPNLVPNKERGWTKSELFVQRSRIMKDPSVAAAGILSSITGGRYDLLLADDVVDYKNAVLNPSLRIQVQEAFYNNWLNLADSVDSEVAYVATLWTDADLSYHILKKDSQPSGSFFTKVYRIDDDFHPLWEVKWPESALRQRCKDLGWYAFNRAFRNIVISADDAIFNASHIDNMRIAGVGKSPEDYITCTTYMGVDLAIGRGRNACRTAVFVVALTPDKKRVPLDVTAGQFTSPATARLIYEKYNKWHPDMLRVENNAYQQALIDWCAELIPDMHVEAHFTGSQKLDMDVGIPALAVEMSHGSWVLPQGPQLHPDDCKCGFCQWVEELRTFPFGRTDIVLSSWLAREALRRTTSRGPSFAVWDMLGD